MVLIQISVLLFRENDPGTQLSEVFNQGFGFYF